MERRIYEAAVEGSVESLISLIQEDALVLDRFMVSCYSETPLHIASMLGQVDFVQEILNRKPELAGELDSRRSSPLHLATAKGYLDIVSKLVRINPEMCFARDRDGKNPLHIAAIKGRVDILREFVQVRPQAARVLMDQGDTILHACVRYNQLGAMKLLIQTLADYEFLNSKDNDGNTILHLAAADKQIETIKFLTTSTRIEVNALNANGLAALDALPEGKGDKQDCEMRELLRHAQAMSAKHIHSTTRSGRKTKHSKHQATNQSHHFLTHQDEWLKKKRSTLMVVASLTATMAFQVGVNPPGGLWQDTVKGGDSPHTAGYSIFADNFPDSYCRFLIYNTTGFVASLSIILLLVSGLPFRRRIFMWILMVIMWVAITAIAWTYLISIQVFTPNAESGALISILETVILVWMGLMLTLLLGHTIRLLVRLIKYIRKSVKRWRASSSASASMLMSHSEVSTVDNLNNV
ncbi:Ankyrin repeat family protein [Melia azedarach]|uniref:Ankyrin repeat family protein n=1 Tax=Melia azedarach TaxID=155640 RepID=A0ACC1XCC2_MELAZ|nr:Ankyrin repeat family protein [Melia azedarach]